MVPKASAEDLEPSFARMLNSLTASPTLSMDHMPDSAPAMSDDVNSCAESPSDAYWFEYSFSVSSRSPFWLAPRCAPTVMSP